MDEEIVAETLLKLDEELLASLLVVSVVESYSDDHCEPTDYNLVPPGRHTTFAPPPALLHPYALYFHDAGTSLGQSLSPVV